MPGTENHTALNMKKKSEETACLTEVQLGHIIDAARDVPGACPKAQRFVRELRPEKDEKSPAVEFIQKTLARKIRKIFNSISDFF